MTTDLEGLIARLRLEASHVTGDGRCESVYPELIGCAADALKAQSSLTQELAEALRELHDEGGNAILGMMLAGKALEKYDTASAKPAVEVDELATLVRMLVRHVPEAQQIRARALDYLMRHGLTGSPLRSPAKPTVEVEEIAEVLFNQRQTRWNWEYAVEAHPESPAGELVSIVRDDAKAVLAALSAGADREGWKLVPVEPTQEMMNAAPASFSPSFTAIWPKVCGDIYRAMLAASPPRPGGGDAQKDEG